MKYRKKPVVVEALQWTGHNVDQMMVFCAGKAHDIYENSYGFDLTIHTLEGDHHASVGDYIIKGVHGELYPCKPDIFAETYELAE